MCLWVLNHVFILFASLGCRVWHNKRSRQTESWSYLQYFGILWCWLSDWSVTDVCSQIRNHGWDVFNHQLFVSMLFLSLQFFFFIWFLPQHQHLLPPLKEKHVLFSSGLWTGLLTCVFLQCLFLIFYLIRMNWKNVTVEVCV